MAGALALQGYNGLTFIMGWTGGYVLLGVLIRLLRFYTTPTFREAWTSTAWILFSIFSSI